MPLNHLEHLKVIELASVLAGPAVGTFFAELGAEVIKIENKTTGGDVTRRWKLSTEDPEQNYSAYYCSTNWGKTRLFLDLKQKTDQEVVYKMVKEVDIVISNFKPSSAIKMGMDYASLKAINPSLIYAELTAFGPDSARPAFDVVLQAEAGFLYMCGEADRPPVKMPVALIDLLAAHQLKEGILLALLRREQTGKGAFVSTSLLEAAIASLANQAGNWLMVGHIPSRMGTAHPNIAPYGDIFETSDAKPIVIAAGTEKQFQLLCKCLGQADLATNEKFKNNALRVQHREALNKALVPLFAQYSREEILAILHENKIPVGSIRNMKEVFELEMAQQMIQEEMLPDGKIAKSVKTVVFKLQ
jgi:crotonobetainyl-CoA:carnitine CoA-transferase CaiB-like acyl-CoA transferase